MISYTAGKVTQNLIYICFLSPARFKLLGDGFNPVFQRSVFLCLPPPILVCLGPVLIPCPDTPAVVLTVPSA